MSDRNTTARTPGGPNRLIDETSPYLLQHAHNPVDWYPWSEEAFRLAEETDRPIFLSVGYSACHWCHVMEHESFENEEIAAILNESFVSIKVDREERPDVDQIYMTAVQLITRRGGWPMSVFMTPDGRPFYGGTYWPPVSRMGMPGFRDILVKLRDYWQNKKDEVETSANQLSEAIQDMAAPVFQSAKLGEETLKAAVEGLLRIADRKHGGFGGAPKFPHPMDLRFLLRGWERFHNGDVLDEDVLDVIQLTLKKMLNGGIYDQLGGGFHRYSTDAYWLAPHFEKMLYDNALLVPVYLEAWQVTGDQEYERCVRETLDYVLREMTSELGGFYSTQDADTEGEEGRFFVWSLDEVRQLLGERESEIFSAVYDVSQNGNWEGHSILNRPKPLDQVAEELKVDVKELAESLDRSRSILFEARSRRTAPARDEKVLTAWNGMMISAFAQAGVALNEPKYLSAAQAAADFFQLHMKGSGKELLLSYKDGRSRFRGYLDDYACLIDGLVELFRATGSDQYLEESLELADVMIAEFWDPEQGGFFFTDNDHEKLIARTKEVQDNAVPSGNGMAATALVKLGQLTGRSDLMERAINTLESFGELLADRPQAVGQALIALDLVVGPSRQLVLVESEDEKGASKLGDWTRSQFLPRTTILRKDQFTESKIISSVIGDKETRNGATTAYLCEGQTCQEPVTSIEELERQIRNNP
ncbi:Glycosyl Hydrolase Family 88 [Thalassoglobus neptunius]|uniref:Glycosyl Hydrolase Family 88 n=1 Tax=Thalassoglobus neptunius TaxID=1938619 RepID=A0A5C5X1E0_9PLAN|nr:thioredoxin domain-containing protein [Thalassoglobus neptunius]TWT56954.1 Glycosyl Hydrolase Family 88 [Thalassoglobus neptunius]